MKISKLLALALALVLALSIAAMAEDGDLSEPGVLPIWTGSEPYTLTVLVTPNDYVTDWDDNAFTHWIEESCNVNLEFEFLPKVDATQKLGIMVQTGETLPDIICVGLSNDVAYDYGQAGAILNLQPYYDAGLCVNVDSADSRFPTWSVKGNITNYDGSIYAIPKIQASLSNETKYKLWINTALMAEVGETEMPTTTDEFKDLLIKFRDADYLPLLGSSSWGGSPVKFLTNAFVYEGDNDMWMLKDGEVTASYVQDEWFEACDYLRDLCQEGLLLPESFTYGRPDIVAVAAQSNVLGALFDSSMGFFASKDTPEYQIRLNYWPCDPLVGPNGYQGVAYEPSTTSSMWFVTKDCTNPELAVRVGDFIFCEEGFLRGRFGVEGENWIKVETYLAEHPDAEIYFANYDMGLEPTYMTSTPDYSVKDSFGTPGNVQWYDQMPYFSGWVESMCANARYDENGVDVIDANVNHGTRQGTSTAVMQALKPGSDVVCPKLAFSPEEIEEISEIRASVKTFVNEQRTLYIRGEASKLDNKEDFLNELNTIGFERLMEVANAAYERQYK